MVLVNQGLPTGPLSSDTMDRLLYSRYAVIGLWICAFLRLFVDNPFNGLSTAFSAVTGTYTFMNDTQFSKCYDFMARNCMFCGTGGSQCLGPFMTVCLINAVFDFFRVLSLVWAGVALLVPLTTLVVLIAVVLQGVAFYQCLRVYKDMIQPLDSPLPRSDDNRRPFLQSSYIRVTDGPGFVPFGGEGRRLG
jgi:hypothetical protein